MIEVKNRKGYSCVLVALAVLSAISMSCVDAKPETAKAPATNIVTYENELFSIVIPNGWMVDDAEWRGLDSLKNEVWIYNPYDQTVSLRIVKTFMPVRWKNIEEATEMARCVRGLSGGNVTLLEQSDIFELGGYPACVLLFADIVGNDTIIQKQIVSYLDDSHIVMYFNELFSPHNWDEAQRIGDDILGTVMLKKVENPLDDESKLNAAAQFAIDNNQISDETKRRGEEILKVLEKEKEKKKK